jgi:PTS system nitrogen regulatory IIA component
MRVAELITVDRIACDGQAIDKRRALELLSTLIAPARDDLGCDGILGTLMAREELGSTGFGQGFALPHGRVGSGGPVAAFARLVSGVEFDAVDRQPVDLLFATLVPESATDEYLQLLGQLAGLFSQSDFREALRRAPDPQAVHEIFASWQSQTH